MWNFFLFFSLTVNLNGPRIFQHGAVDAGISGPANQPGPFVQDAGRQPQGGHADVAVGRGGEGNAVANLQSFRQKKSETPSPGRRSPSGKRGKSPRSLARKAKPGKIIAQITCFPAIHQVIMGAGLAPIALHLKSYALPADKGSLPFKMRTSVGPTENGEKVTLLAPPLPLLARRWRARSHHLLLPPSALLNERGSSLSLFAAKKSCCEIS